MSLFIKFEAFLLTEKRVADNTFAAYKRDLAQFAAFLENNHLTIETVQIKAVKRFLAEMKDQGISARSLARKISTLKAFFNFAHERFEIRNCAENLIFPKLKKGLPTFLSEQEIEILLKVAEGDTTSLGIRNKTILYLLYVTGMRISELVTLKVSDIQFDTGLATIKGKGGKERVIPVPTQMLDMLRIYLNTVHKEALDRKKLTNHLDYLFPTSYAGKIKPITRQACWMILNSLWAKTGIKKRISPHQLRHSLATHMLKNGVDLRSLQLILGHENLSTIEIYTHVEISHLRNVYDKKHPRS